MLAIPRKQRAMVRKGIKEGLRAEIDDDVDRIYDMYSESLRNLGTPVFSKRYLRRCCKEVFGEACDIVTILKGDRAVASVLNFYFRDEVLPYYGGGTQEARAVAGNDFMYWQVMERARREGLPASSTTAAASAAPAPSTSRPTGASSPSRCTTSTSS